MSSHLAPVGGDDGPRRDRLAELLAAARPGDPDPDPVPAKEDRLARIEYDRDARWLPAGPPYDLADRLARDARDAQYLVENARTMRELAHLWHDRYVAYEDGVLALVMAADRGGSLTKHLDRLRELLPPTRYRRPRRR